MPDVTLENGAFYALEFSSSFQFVSTIKSHLVSRQNLIASRRVGKVSPLQVTKVAPNISFLQYQLATGQHLMGLIDIIKPLSTVPSINLCNIKRKILGNEENQIWGCWVRSKYATSVLRSAISLKDRGLGSGEKFLLWNSGPSALGARICFFGKSQNESETSSVI